MKPIELKQFIKNVFTDVLENIQTTEDTYEKYFSKDYKQYVDGKTLNYTGFIEHMKVLKATLKSVKVTYKHIVTEDDKITTIHIVNALKKDDTLITMQVHALFQVKDNKIILCDELTHLIHGNKSDKDIGSRH